MTMVDEVSPPEYNAVTENTVPAVPLTALFILESTARLMLVISNGDYSFQHSLRRRLTHGWVVCGART